MVPHGSHTNHEFLMLVIRVTNVSFVKKSFFHLRKSVDNDVTCENNFSAFKL